LNKNTIQDDSDRHLGFMHKQHFEFHLSLITRLLLHIFARNLAAALRLRSYIHACQNIEQK